MKMKDVDDFVTLSWNISTNFTRFSSTERPRGAYGMMVSVDGVDAYSELVSYHRKFLLWWREAR
jgi:hypothetical protein